MVSKGISQKVVLVQVQGGNKGNSKISGVLWNEAGPLEGVLEVLQELRKLVRNALHYQTMNCDVFCALAKV